MRLKIVFLFCSFILLQIVHAIDLTGEWKIAGQEEDYPYLKFTADSIFYFGLEVDHGGALPETTALAALGVYSTISSDTVGFYLKGRRFYNPEFTSIDSVQIDPDTGIQQKTFYKGINMNGPALTINGNAWTSYTDAINNGLVVHGKKDPYTVPLDSIKNATGNLRTMLSTSIHTTKGFNSGDGLFAEYYNDTNLTGLFYTKVDTCIFMHWNGSPPAPGIQGHNFSVRWNGYVEPAFSEVYTFFTKTNDGVRLWVNDSLIINKWFDQNGCTEWNGSIALACSTRYPITMEYYEDAYNEAFAELRWQCDSGIKQIIPRNRLYSALSTEGNISIEQPVPNGFYQVYLWIMENDSSFSRNINIKHENVAADAIDVGNLNRFEWEKYGPFTTKVIDDTLDIDLIDENNTGCLLQGLEMYRVPDPLDQRVYIYKHMPSGDTLIMSPCNSSLMGIMKLLRK